MGARSRVTPLWRCLFTSNVPLELADEATRLGDAIRQYFKARAAGARRNLRELFRRGRISLVIALAFLGVSLTLSDLIGSVSDSETAPRCCAKGLSSAAGWRCGALWKCSCGNWWPWRRDSPARSPERDAGADWRCEEKMSADAWRSDWPAIPGFQTGSPARTRTWNVDLQGDLRCRPITCGKISTRHKKNERPIRIRMITQRSTALTTGESQSIAPLAVRQRCANVGSSTADPFDEPRRNAIFDDRDSQDAVVVKHPVRLSRLLDSSGRVQPSSNPLLSLAPSSREPVRCAFPRAVTALGPASLVPAAYRSMTCSVFTMFPLAAALI